ncbi:unnamed protein product [Lactuca virosa]|uniref:Uncharacterized protein n=1 Tax=Lactuca virosa TaxID=75947 RepID=A0AAU9NRH2_9ASTR|nr:unnamed protein product [Lactuca virosa]
MGSDSISLLHSSSQRSPASSHTADPFPFSAPDLQSPVPAAIFTLSDHLASPAFFFWFVQSRGSHLVDRS